MEHLFSPESPGVGFPFAYCRKNTLVKCRRLVEKQWKGLFAIPVAQAMLLYTRLRQERSVVIACFLQQEKDESSACGAEYNAADDQKQFKRDQCHTVLPDR